MQYNMTSEDVKKVIESNDGYAFHVLNKMFWKSVIESSLEMTKGNKTKACEMLGISRQTMAAHNDRT